MIREDRLLLSLVRIIDYLVKTVTPAAPPADANIIDKTTDSWTMTRLYSVITTILVTCWWCICDSETSGMHILKGNSDSSQPGRNSDSSQPGGPGIALSPFGGGEKTLVTTRSFQKNEEIIRVPSFNCLLVHRDGSVFHGLQGQLDASLDEVGDLRSPLTDDQINQGRTWDCQLAMALLDATAGTSIALNGEFYDQYALDLVRPEYLSLPLCMSSLWMLDQIQASSIKEGAIAQQNRLRSISALFADARAHRITSAAEERKQDIVRKQTSAATSPPPLSPLQWAFAMVRSRCFKVGPDSFAFVPMVDMANHDPLHPTAVFETVPDAAVKFSAFALRAARDLDAGTEITISYGDGHDNDRLFVQYGFTMDANPNDSIAWPSPFPLQSDCSRVEDVKSRVCELLLTAADKMSKSDLRVHAATRSLLKRISDIPTKSSSDGTGQSPPDASVIAAVQEQAEAVLKQLSGDTDDMCASFPTTLAVDQSILENLRALPLDTTYIRRHEVEQWMNSGEGASPTNEVYPCIENVCQLRACLRYRIEKKQLLEVARNIVRLSISSYQ